MQELREDNSGINKTAPVELVPGAFQMSSVKCPWCGELIEDRHNHVGALDILQHHMWGVHSEKWRAMVKEAVLREVNKEKTNGNAR